MRVTPRITPESTHSPRKAVMAPASSSTAQQWEMKPTGEVGWFLLCNRATGNCLDNIGNLAPGAPVRLWGTSWHPNQQWRLIR